MFLISGWSSPTVRVAVNGQPLAEAHYRGQVHDHGMVIRIEGKHAQATRLSFQA